MFQQAGEHLEGLIAKADLGASFAKNPGVWIQLEAVEADDV
jgi:hypothetical protein